jgi:tetratricopeptide (TPR) repeat protein
MQEGDARSALDVLDRLGEQRVNRDSGLLSQKIRCLHGMGRRVEADQLMNILKTIDDDYGEYEGLLAARSVREGRYDEALAAIARAKAKPKSNKLNLTLLEAATKIDAGVDVDVEEVCKAAAATGRLDDAHSLRARAALRKGQWADSEQHLNKIERFNYFDKVLMVQTLDAKTRDMSVRADPALLRKTKEYHERLVVETRATPLTDERWS